MDALIEFRRKMQENIHVTTAIVSHMNQDEIITLIHELWVRQVELDIENETLRHAQHDLESSLQYYADLYDFAPVGLCAFYKDGVLLNVNSTLAELLGVSRESVIHASIFHYVVSDDQPLFQQYLQKLFTTRQPQYCELRLIHVSGSHIYVQLESRLRHDERYTGQCWMTVSDITERKQAQETLEGLMKQQSAELSMTAEQLREEAERRKRVGEALQETERQYRILAQNVADGIGILQERKFVFANTALSLLFGLPDGKLLNINPLELIHKEYQADVEEILKEVETSGASEPFLAQGLPATGKTLWIEGEFRAMDWKERPAILLTAKDITEHKLQNIALEQEQTRLKKEITALKSSMKERYRFGEIIGKSAAMQEVYEQAMKAAATDASVFIYGESGTGKELIARTIHDMSKRRDQRFVPVNCGAIPENLFESEFFGHRRGAFTGAIRDKLGLFAVAHKGTLFLDELGELPAVMQVKLLRVLDEGEFTPIGETSVKKTDVRIIAATNRNLEDLRRRRIVREDFFFRIHVFAITVPPLRERKDDIPLLLEYFVRHFCGKDAPPVIPGHVLDALQHYDWPGNVREFQNVIQRYLSGQPLNLIESKKEETPKPRALLDAKAKPKAGEFHEVMDDFEKKMILEMLEQHRWNKSKTAASLGIPRRTLYRKMERYGIM